jgi:hypothetical protein
MQTLPCVDSRRTVLSIVSSPGFIWLSCVANRTSLRYCPIPSIQVLEYRATLRRGQIVRLSGDQGRSMLT